MVLDPLLYIRIPRDKGVTLLNEAQGSFYKVKKRAAPGAAIPLSKVAPVEPIHCPLPRCCPGSGPTLVASVLCLQKQPYVWGF